MADRAATADHPLVRLRRRVGRQVEVRRVLRYGGRWIRARSGAELTGGDGESRVRKLLYSMGI